MKYLKTYEGLISGWFKKKKLDDSITFAIGDYVRRKKDGKIGEVKIVGINSSPEKYDYFFW
jgi:hypothetical protein